MPTNNFKVFAGAAGAGVVTQAAYEGLAALSAGFSTGTAVSTQLNKVWRQSSIMSAVLSQFIVNHSGADALDDGTIATLLANLDASVNSMILASAPQVPAGAILTIPQATAPAGYLKANGAVLPRASYPALWAAAQASANITATDAAWSISTAGSYSPGDGSTTFRIPDLRGLFIRALTDGSGIDSGRLLGTYQADDFKSHTHGNFPNTWGGQGQEGSSGFNRPAVADAPNYAGGAETRPKNTALLMCIKY